MNNYTPTQRLILAQLGARDYQSCNHVAAAVGSTPATVYILLRELIRRKDVMAAGRGPSACYSLYRNTPVMSFRAEDRRRGDDSEAADDGIGIGVHPPGYAY